MLGSRLHKVGSVFARVTGLLKSGAMKENDIPLWYYIYKAFPPKYEPKYDRPVEYKDIKPIFYQEDIVRAKFYKKYGGSVSVVDMLSPESKPLSQRFIEKYLELEKSGNHSDVFKETENVLKAEGLLTRSDQFSEKKKADTLNAEPLEKLTGSLNLVVKDIFKDSDK